MRGRTYHARHISQHPHIRACLLSLVISFISSIPIPYLQIKTSIHTVPLHQSCPISSTTLSRIRPVSKARRRRKAGRIRGRRKEMPVVGVKGQRKTKARRTAGNKEMRPLRQSHCEH
ncbi:hypothetical protein BDW02DRAFT_634420 [Decorospora gaudefroyi]|uniref:Uncharacterized protein n=1 Tax=Decorospora gaudefroyi TaxID=184978 RepID=A0A6A5JYP5_9PLEO|nr:hypothetical protein BDW02DRAFT_634420 [Decorospora gaudefroyi]